MSDFSFSCNNSISVDNNNPAIPMLHHSCPNPNLSLLQWKVIPQLVSMLHLLNILLSFLLPPLYILALLPLQSLINDYQMTSIFVT